MARTRLLQHILASYDKYRHSRHTSAFHDATLAFSGTIPTAYNTYALHSKYLPFMAHLSPQMAQNKLITSHLIMSERNSVAYSSKIRQQWQEGRNNNPIIV